MILSHLSTSISHCKTSSGCAEGGDESPATVEICKTYALAVKEIWDQMQILCVSIAGWVVGLVFSFPLQFNMIFVLLHRKPNQVLEGHGEGSE